MPKSTIIITTALLLIFIGIHVEARKKSCTRDDHSYSDGSPDFSDSPDTSDIPDSSDSPDNSGIPDAPDSSDLSDVSDPSDSSSLSYCNTNARPDSCTTESVPVCAHIANCIEGVCNKTMSNACEACFDITIDYYSPGECPIVKTICNSTKITVSCPDDWDPVCVYLSQCVQADNGCFQTGYNPCDGCKMANAQYYIPGECTEE